METDPRDLAYKIDNEIRRSFLKWLGLFYTGNVITVKESPLGIDQLAPEMTTLGCAVNLTPFPVGLRCFEEVLNRGIFTYDTYARFNRLLRSNKNRLYERIQGCVYYDPNGNMPPPVSL